MKLQTLLIAGLCGAVLALAGPESAQAQRASESRPQKQEVLFPEATRESPKPKSGRLTTQLQKAFKAFDKDDFSETIKIAEEVAGNERANAYERSQAYYIAGVAAQQADEDGYARAIDYFVRAIEANGLDNNVHYQVMQQLAQMHLAEEKYEDALSFVDRFIGETKQQKADTLLLRGNVLFRLERFPAAIESLEKAIAASEQPQPNWLQLLMAAYAESDQFERAAAVAERIVADKPNDKSALQNLIAIHMQADQPQKAGEVFDRMRAAGLMTESRDYEHAFRLLANIDGRENDAIDVIKEGLDRKILQPSHDVYNFLGQSYYFSERAVEAIEAWKLAAPLAKDGETFLNLAKVMTMEARFAEGKAAAQQALAKGVKSPGDAWMTIARAEYGDDGKNRAGVLAAYREAAKYPETKAQAEKAIAQMSR